MTQEIYYQQKRQIAQSKLSDSKKEFQKYALWEEYIKTSTQKSKYD